MARIELDHVHKTYPDGHVASRDLDLAIEDGEFLVFVGPSGCGKSTALRIIAGLETPTEGRVRIGDRDVTDVSPQERDIAMVFQSYALYPHMTVRENLSFGLRIRKMPADEVEGRVETAARALGLEPMLDRKPAQLSGGQRQRVALGRALVREPQAFLLDEPLSNLDAKLRIETRAELARLHQRLGTTMVYVTHDQEEAMTLGDRVAVLRDGVLQQVAPPMELYRRPANRFVGGFIGSPAMNFFDGSLLSGEDGWRFRGDALEVRVEAPGEASDGERVTLGVRPPDVQLAEDGSPVTVGAEVAVIEPIGSQQIVHASLPDETRIVAVLPVELDLEEGREVALRLPVEAIHLFHADSGERLE
ncbi:MAG: sn-glycerol-3-phosphate ABC transporter ATP-binding protein UgpC [Gemmatimonadota bacterium]|nr:sn-glycerol-3-phosphate ABC transporter ATP-binding protein UgpC [Gemmatimonadota bacterium]